MREPVGERGTVVEDELIGALRARLTRFYASLERPVGLPVGQHAQFERGEGRPRRHGFCFTALTEVSPRV